MSIVKWVLTFSTVSTLDLGSESGMWEVGEDRAAAVNELPWGRGWDSSTDLQVQVWKEGEWGRVLGLSAKNGRLT